MRTINIDIKIKKSDKVILKRQEVRVAVTEGMTVLDVKNHIKSNLNLPLEITSEELYFGDKMKDTDLVPNKSGLEYIVVVK